MEQQVLNKLEWEKIQERLANYCQSKQAKTSALTLLPHLTTAEIIANWRLLTAFKELCQRGERAPVGEIDNLSNLFVGIGKGIILTSLELRSIYRLLEGVQRVATFSRTHSAFCPPLVHLKDTLKTLPQLVKRIAQAVHPDGTINEEASPVLHAITNQKQRLRAQVEGQLQQMLSSQEWKQYLQDDYFTLRSERYVIPIKIDGRGRVAGTIVDTSDSGQTLFVEPTVIRDLNSSLQDLELSLKLEIIRIFKELTQLVHGDLHTLEENYREMIRLDFLSAQAEYALDLAAHAIHIAEEPLVDLIAARHPLLIAHPSGTSANPVVANSLGLDQKQPVMIISGPNAGGKTVVLKTASILLCMMKAGLLIPAEPSSRLYNFRRIYLNLGDAQNLSADLSTFTGHLTELKPLFSEASTVDLVCLDEIAVGTEPQTGAAIAQAILEFLADKGILSLVTTHYEGLKILALQNSRFRNAAMEYGLNTMHPTYRLTLDIPGQSYGLEVAKQVGLPAAILERAKTLRGSKIAEIEEAFAQLLGERQNLSAARQSLETELAHAATEKVRWQKERELLQESRSQLAKKLQAKYAQEFAEQRQEYEDLLKRLREKEQELVRQLAGSSRESKPIFHEESERLKSTFKGMKETLTRLDQQFHGKDELPGKEVNPGELQVGDAVYLVSLGKNAVISKIGKSAQDKIEVAIGAIKLVVPLENLRKLTGAGARKVKQSAKPLPKERSLASRQGGNFSGELKAEAPPAPINILDLRGLEVGAALAQLWKFIDAAVMRGEYRVMVIHGHGSGSLKSAIRQELSNDKNYRLQIQPGSNEEGGDGVTIVTFA